MTPKMLRAHEAMGCHESGGVTGHALRGQDTIKHPYMFITLPRGGSIQPADHSFKARAGVGWEGPCLEKARPFHYGCGHLLVWLLGILMA